MLGLERDLSAFYAQAGADAVLGPLAERFCGVKPPRFPTVFECLLNAVACQQLSIEAGLALLNRLAAAARPDDPAPRPFPSAAEVARLPAGALRAAGFSGRKAETIAALASGDVDLEGLDGSDELALAALQRLRGIGPWSADYVLLRGLGRTHVFPRRDAGALNGLGRLLAGGAEEPAHALARWAPYAGLVYFHLLLRGLEARGVLDDPSDDGDDDRDRASC